MSGTKRVLMLLAVLVAMIAGFAGMAAAQVPTTTVSDTVYSANGTPVGGTALVSWSSFTTAGGQTVPAGSTSATIGTGGQLSIALTPNIGASPMGSYYTAIFHLSDGTISREYWVVPVTVPGGGPATLAEIKNLGQPGRLHQLEGRVEEHERSVQRLKGAGIVFGGILTMLHLLVVYLVERYAKF
ncbi:hypothetical protein [Granulicella sp. L46]|uniref:hypothetical protein n=1 Tax=Granulicella sp. L46 TaxID=1641865 RepID=UPI00131B261B|nr:hypothetical protein [Granulicella sp. L46]